MQSFVCPVSVSHHRSIIKLPGSQDVGGKKAEEIIAACAVPAEKFIWHAVARAVGNVKNQSQELIEQVT